MEGQFSALEVHTTMLSLLIWLHNIRPGIVMPPKLFFLLWGYLMALCILKYFSTYVKNGTGIWWLLHLTFQIWGRDIAIFTVLILLPCEHERSFCYLVSASISSFSIIYFISKFQILLIKFFHNFIHVLFIFLSLPCPLSYFPPSPASPTSSLQISFSYY